MRTRATCGRSMGVLFLLVGGIAQPLRAQAVEPRPLTFPHADEIVRGPGFAVMADRRTFAVTAFLNAVGYDEEVDGQEMHPVRERVREAMAENLLTVPEKVAVWRDFYARDGLPLFVWMDYALSLSEDYPFQRIRPIEEMGYAQVLEETDAALPLLNEFWIEADMEAIWEEVKPDYLAELRQYDFDRMEEQMEGLWGYLRLPRRDTYTIVNVPNLMGQHYTAIGASYESFYYTVETPGAQSYSLNIHEYLHSIVNPLSVENFGSEEEKLTRWYEAGREDQYAASYQFAPTFVSECLVRALDYRLRLREAEDEEEAGAIQARVDDLSTGGLSLVGPFFDALKGMEEGSLDFTEFVPVLFHGIPDPAPGNSGDPIP